MFNQNKEEMKRYLGVLLALFMIVIGFTSCTDNQRAKQFGGDMTIEVPTGQKVTNITWKESELWYSTRPFTEDEVACTQTFHESSNWGIMEGSVTFVEKNTDETASIKGGISPEAVAMMDPGLIEMVNYSYTEQLEPKTSEAETEPYNQDEVVGFPTNRTEEGFSVVSDGIFAPRDLSWIMANTENWPIE